jgi:hypothetical protein
MSEPNDADVSYSEAADILSETVTFEGTTDFRGTEIPLVVEEPEIGELEAIEAEMDEDSEEIDVAKELIDQYLVKPEVDPSGLGITAGLGLFAGMQELWRQSDEFEKVREQLELDPGNR